MIASLHDHGNEPKDWGFRNWTGHVESAIHQLGSDLAYLWLCFLLEKRCVSLQALASSMVPFCSFFLPRFLSNSLLILLKKNINPAQGMSASAAMLTVPDYSDASTVLSESNRMKKPSGKCAIGLPWLV